MIIHRAHKIRLCPNNKQANYFARACGCARFIYNWGLEQWQKQYEAGEKPNAYALKKQFNNIKRIEFPFVYEVTKCATEQSFNDLGHAFQNFFRNVKAGKKPGYPKFKKRGKYDSFYLANDVVKTRGNRVFISKLGWVKMREPLRFEGKIMSATVSKTADMWFISISAQQEMPELVPPPDAVGVDVGIKELAVTSDGEVFENPKALKTAEKRLRRLHKSVSRKKKGSNNRKKAVLKLARQYYRISCVRKDAIHKATSAITTGYGVIGIENLNVKGMLKNHKLAKAISDVAFSEFHRQLEYKAAWRGGSVVKADRWFPSSKMCSACGHIMETLPLSVREWTCPKCGAVHDRDRNASINLKQYAVGSTVKACRLGSAGLNMGSSETTNWAGISHMEVMPHA
ncbi:MAG: RNA-guided endonuclease TnpB family protein [Planctomycetota bacterium]|nr:RNA-guided endonuclease TnpB family protein [Planctomycetota bacterium]